MRKLLVRLHLVRFGDRIVSRKINDWRVKRFYFGMMPHE